jgi:hypothetical protein
MSKPGSECEPFQYNEALSLVIPTGCAALGQSITTEEPSAISMCRVLKFPVSRLKLMLGTGTGETLMFQRYPASHTHASTLEAPASEREFN